jgi:two-component system, OmpR family, sensor histidine kinase KdpD
MKDAEDYRDPQEFLDLCPQTKSSKLRIYLGCAAGVGKTYRMLEEAHRLRTGAHDVMLGFIETHGRSETVARVGDMERVPLKKVLYRGVLIEEMDVDAILARKPEFAIVDELPTNVAGSKHSRRYQDIEELLEHGINVITAFNIQHLESLDQMIRRITGIEVRETVPDTFFGRADEVVAVDISVEELRHRLREGKIYPPERIEGALRNFFRPSNLAVLRELALLEVAREQGRHREALELLQREGGRRIGVSERFMVCLSSNPEGSKELLRKAARAAAHLNAQWYAVHVETPNESVQRISTVDFRALLNNINLAADLGAEVVWPKSPDVVKGLLDFARDKKITRIIVGRTHPTLLNRLLRRSLTSRILAEGSDFDPAGGCQGEDACQFVIPPRPSFVRRRLAYAGGRSARSRHQFCD